MFFDTDARKTVEISQFVPNRTYELRIKNTAPPNAASALRRDGRKYVTFFTEKGKFENVEIRDSDSEERQAAILRGYGIHGPRSIRIEEREVKWSDLQTGDIAFIERITDASVWVVDGPKWKNSST
jgi:hypothetical protein